MTDFPRRPPTDEPRLDIDPASGPYARFWRPAIAPLAPHVVQAVAAGPLPPPQLPPLSAAPTLLEDADWPIETGYTIGPAGDARVFVRTLMPGVTPRMWEWWFAWHGSESARYRLWHPHAHVTARWADGLGELRHYVGRTSLVEEYIGATFTRLAIRFVPPHEVGIDQARLGAAHVAICARAGPLHAPFDLGWLVHHVRATVDGSEMRSRFWIGGPYVETSLGMRGLGRFAALAVSRAAQPTREQAVDLLVHCAQEMSHLAGLLPELYAAFGPQRAEGAAP